MKIEIPYYMMDSSEAFQRSHQPTAEELIKNSYRSLDSSFKRFPFFSARIYSLIYYSVMFSPVFLIVMGWALSFVLDYGSRVYYLFRGEWRQINLSEVSRSVSLLVIPEEEVPVARPVSLFFGLYTFVVISEAVRSELSDEQLKSVVAHEFYHLRNRDMFVNMVASFLSIGFSSRNALLAFYDYTQSEKEADDFARETVGLDPTVIAIDKLDVLAKNAEGRRLPWGGPEFVRSPIKEQSFGRIGGVLKSSAAVLLAPYQLLFGRIILDTAHLNSESRIERLKNLS